MVGVGEGGEGWGSWSFRLAFRRVLALLWLFWMCARMAGVSAGMALVLSGLGCVLVVRSIRGYGGLGGRAGRGRELRVGTYGASVRVRILKGGVGGGVGGVWRGVLARRPLLISMLSLRAFCSSDSFFVTPKGSKRLKGTGCGISLNDLPKARRTRVSSRPSLGCASLGLQVC